MTICSEQCNPTRAPHGGAEVHGADDGRANDLLVRSQDFGEAEPRRERRTVEPVYWADIGGEALWDLLTLWTLVAAAVLLLLDHNGWPCFGLWGGAVCLYSAGRGILTRLEMQRRGFRIGDPSTVRLGLIMLSVWGGVGVITIVASITSLTGS